MPDLHKPGLPVAYTPDYEPLSEEPRYPSPWLYVCILGFAAVLAMAYWLGVRR